MRTVIVIDDNRQLLDLIGRYLQRMRFRVLLAGNGKEGIELFEKESEVAAVFTDLDMPVMDGYGVARHIQKNNGCKSRIIAITGDIEADTQQLFDGVLYKPFELERLLDFIDRRG